MTRSSVWVAEPDSTRSVLHTMINASTVVESYWERKTGRFRRGCSIFPSQQHRVLSSLSWGTCNIFSILMFILLLYLNKFNSCHSLILFLNPQDIFKELHLSLHRGIYHGQKAAFLPACPGETLPRQIFSSPCISESFTSAEIMHTT
jgi:hypothetical protein